jgi:ribosomal protein S18 acetylase RimI-like enzyme
MTLKMIEEDIQIENASIHDADVILKIQKAAFLGQAEIYNSQLPPLTQSLESIRSEFDTKTFLKVILEGKIVASVRFDINDGYVNIDRIVVEPEYQGRGIGKAMLEAVESRVPDAVAYQLFTGSKSKRNINLYKRVGYEIVRSEVTDQGIELLYMEKRS